VSGKKIRDSVYFPGPQFGSDSGQYTTTPLHSAAEIRREASGFASIDPEPLLSITFWGEKPDGDCVGVRVTELVNVCVCDLVGVWDRVCEGVDVCEVDCEGEPDRDGEPLELTVWLEDWDCVFDNDREADCVWLGVCVALAVWVWLGVADSDGVIDWVGVEVGVRDCVGVVLKEAERLGVSVALGDCVWLVVAECEELRDWDEDSVCVGDCDGVADRDADWLRVCVKLDESVWLDVIVSLRVALCDDDWESVLDCEGVLLNEGVWLGVGVILGLWDGLEVCEGLRVCVWDAVDVSDGVCERLNDCDWLRVLVWLAVELVDAVRVNVCVGDVVALGVSDCVCVREVDRVIVWLEVAVGLRDTLGVGEHASFRAKIRIPKNEVSVAKLTALSVDTIGARACANPLAGKPPNVVSTNACQSTEAEETDHTMAQYCDTSVFIVRVGGKLNWT
jgi:hypothetical protein